MIFYNLIVRLESLTIFQISQRFQFLTHQFTGLGSYKESCYDELGVRVARTVAPGVGPEVNELGGETHSLLVLLKLDVSDGAVYETIFQDQKGTLVCPTQDSQGVLQSWRGLLCRRD